MERNGVHKRVKTAEKEQQNDELNGNIRFKKQAKLKRKQQNSILVALSNVRSVVECLFCNFLFVWFVFLLLPIVVVNFVLKKIEHFLVGLKMNAVPLRGEDAIWRQDSDTNRLIITSVMFVDKPEDFTKSLKDFKQVVNERLVTYKNIDGSVKFPRVKKFIRPGFFQYFFVEDKHFDIDNHVFKYNGEPPKSEEELQAIVSKISSEPLPENRPPWYFSYIPTEFGNNKVAVIFRIHHCMADGVSMSRFMTRILPDEYIPQKETRKFTSLGRGLMQLKALFISARVMISLFLSFADRSVIHGKPMIGKKKCVWSEPIDLNFVKRIKNMTGTTVNDVLVACLTMAMRKYFQEKGAQKPADFTASIPVDVSAPTEAIEFQNKFSVVFIKLPSSLEGALNILSETKARIDAVKLSGEPFAMAWLMNTSVELLPDLLIKPFISFISSKASCVLSNVPGPQYCLSVGGNRINSWTFWPPQRNNIGIGISIFSYGGQVVIGVQGDLEVMKDPEVLTKMFGQSIQELAAIVLHGEKCNGETIMNGWH